MMTIIQGQMQNYLQSIFQKKFIHIPESGPGRCGWLKEIPKRDNDSLIDHEPMPWLVGGI
jgi:hypothetical protein